MSQPPTQTLGRFSLERLIGSSSFATVYAARDSTNGRTLALKVFRRYLSEERSLMERYRLETLRVAALAHPNILPIVDAGQEEGSPWVTMDLMPASLKDRMGAPLPAEEVARLARDVAAAMNAAHQAGILHQDLKPSNVFQAPSGAHVLADFGMANLAAGTHPLVRASSTTPLPAYMSPEQALGMTVSPRSDVYSLGVLAYHLLTGRVPYGASDPTTIWAKQMAGPPPRPDEAAAVPSAVAEVVLRALAANPERRPATTLELAEDLWSAAQSPLAMPAVRMQPVAAAPAPVASSPPAPVGAPASPTATMVACRICGHQNPPALARCEACWARLTQEPVATEARRWGLASFSEKSRRVALVGSLAAVVAMLAVALLILGEASVVHPVSALTASSGPGEWAMHQGNPAHTGAVVGAVSLPKGTVRWSLITPAPIAATPAVAEGVVFLPTGDRRVLALRATDGAVQWEAPVSGPVDSTPAVAGNSVFVGLRDGSLVSFDRATGARRWTYPTGGPIFSSPTVKDGVVYIGNGGGELHAVDAFTGKRLWRFTVGEWISSSPAVSDDGVLVFGSRDGNVYFLEADSGKLRLVYRPVVGIESSATIRGDRTYIGTDVGAVLALNLTERRRPLDKQVQRVKLQLWVWQMLSSPPEQRGYVWTARPGRENTINSTPVIGENAVFTTVRDGLVAALDRKTGKRLWTFRIEPPLVTSPVLAGGLLYVSSGAGKVYALDPTSGKPVWQWAAPTPGQSSTTPVLAAGLLLEAVSQDRADIAVYRIGQEGRPEPNAPEEAQGNWWYRYGPTACMPAPPAPAGPFPSRGDALSAAQLAPPACGVLYAVD